MVDVKKNLTEFVELIDIRLEEYWDREMRKDFGLNDGQKQLIKKMVLHAKEHNLRKAKRGRGFLAYQASRLANNIDENISMNIAMSLELVHTALLMHDDVMDQDEVRRGRPTTQKYFEDGDKHYGESMAYMTGDAVLCLGYELMSKCGGPADVVLEAMSRLMRGITNTAYGQAYDVTLEKMKADWTEDDIIALHTLKTALYTYENPLCIGALMAGIKDPFVFESLVEFSKKAGVAFQLQDDILGLYGDPEKTGKSANSDLLQGKCTLLVLHTLKNGNKEQVDAVKRVWGRNDTEEIEIDLARTAIKESGALDYSMEKAKGLATEAVDIIERLKNKRLDLYALENIQAIAHHMVNRTI